MKIFVGIDVQESRGCCFAALGDDGVVLKSGWFYDPGKEACQLVKSFKEKYDVSVGIDSPRMPLILPRNWYWDGNGSGGGAQQRGAMVAIARLPFEYIV